MSNLELGILVVGSIIIAIVWLAKRDEDRKVNKEETQ